MSDETVVLHRQNDGIVRELAEALLIKEHKCVRKSCVTLYGKERPLIGTMFL